MLTGEYQHNMDLKGRVTVPSKFREDLGDKFYVCKGLDGCLFLLSQAQWDKLVEKVSAIPLAQGKGIVIQTTQDNVLCFFTCVGFSVLKAVDTIS